MASVQLQYDSASAHTLRLRDVSDAHAASDALDLPQEIQMSQRDFKLFLVALQSDDEPNDNLRAAAEEYKRNHR